MVEVALMKIGIQGNETSHVTFRAALEFNHTPSRLSLPFHTVIISHSLSASLIKLKASCHLFYQRCLCTVSNTGSSSSNMPEWIHKLTLYWLFWSCLENDWALGFSLLICGSFLYSLEIKSSQLCTIWIFFLWVAFSLS